MHICIEVLMWAKGKEKSNKIMGRLRLDHRNGAFCFYEQLMAFVLILLLLQRGSIFAKSHTIVKSLPGFQGPLPFHLETGYVGVGESEEVQLFYYFIESERNPKEDPLMLWLTGGPGCSSLSGVMFEIGPVGFKIEEYQNGSVPNLILRQHSWTKVCSIIFVDLPVSTGFSYAKGRHNYPSSDTKQVHHAYQFLRKWLIDHPNFLSNRVYIGGDSYSGIPVPVLVQEISNGNKKGVTPFIDLQGYLLGNPATDHSKDPNYAIPHAHGMALISDELYESLGKNCKGEYQIIDPQNTLCLRDIQSYYKCISGINTAHILEPLCGYASPKPQKVLNGRRRSLSQKLETYIDLRLSQLPPLNCRTYGYFLCGYWANNEDVRKALNIREGSIGEWIRCNYGLQGTYEVDVQSSFEYHLNLSTQGYRSLIYSGDHDMLVPFLGTQAWVRSLNYSIVDEWRPWLVIGQVAGYTRTYSNRMTFATVKGGGHTAPEYMPQECLAMFSRWISGRPL